VREFEMDAVRIVGALIGVFVVGLFLGANLGTGTPIGVYRRLAGKSKAALRPFATLQSLRGMPDGTVLEIRTRRGDIDRVARLRAGDFRAAEGFYKELEDILQ
jgi:hypothetical protein